MLFEITEKDYPVVLDLRYATANNVTGKSMYPSARCFLAEAAKPLFEHSLNLCEQQGWTMKIFDAYRPPIAQQKLWDSNPNPNYVTPPERGSPHSRGVALDMTLMSNGQEWEMGGAGFDDMSESGHHGAPVNAEEAYNRYRLLGLMVSAGWNHYMNEWWHYQLFDARDYPIIDQPWWEEN